MESTKWIATIGPNQMICGIGETREEAILDAIRDTGEGEEGDFDTLPCTNEMYEEIEKYGASINETSWGLANGIAYLISIGRWDR